MMPFLDIYDLPSLWLSWGTTKVKVMVFTCSYLSGYRIQAWPMRVLRLSIGQLSPWWLPMM